MSRSSAKTATVQLLRVDGLPAPVEVRRHPTARRLTLRVSHAERAVVLTIPRYTDVREADRFLARSLDWVRQRLERVPDAVPFADGATVPVRGVSHEITHAGRRPGSAVVEIVPPTKSGMRPRLVVSGGAEHAPRRLRDWLASEARRDLETRVEHHCRALKLAAR
ncbi:MAG: YgjP-like metallopeptidase domain-containing protein, partial [Hyphomicrobiaceae bacterium]